MYIHYKSKKPSKLMNLEGFVGPAGLEPGRLFKNCPVDSFREEPACKARLECDPLIMSFQCRFPQVYTDLYLFVPV
jgi:hypothetical protein